MQEPPTQEPRTLKRQVELNLKGTGDTERVWESIPERHRRQIVERYARLIGSAAKSESSAVKMEEVEDDES